MRLILLAAALLLTQVCAAGDEPAKTPAKKTPTPDFLKMMQDSQEAAIPYRGKVVESMLRAELHVLSDPDSAQAMAKYIHNLYESLIKEGFSKEEALQIALKLPPPSIPGPVY